MAGRALQAEGTALTCKRGSKAEGEKSGPVMARAQGVWSQLGVARGEAAELLPASSQGPRLLCQGTL